MSSDNRWRWLLSIVGSLITLSAVVSELSGYTQFLSTLNDGLNDALSSFGLSSAAILGCKIGSIMIVVWVIFYLALGAYTEKYEQCDINKWIFRQKIFLKVHKQDSQRVMHITKTTLFLVAPLKALLTLSMPPWTGARKIFLVSEMPMRAKPYVWEALFYHAVLAAGGMAIYLGLRIVEKIV